MGGKRGTKANLPPSVRLLLLLLLDQPVQQQKPRWPASMAVSVTALPRALASSSDIANKQVVRQLATCPEGAALRRSAVSTASGQCYWTKSIE